MRLKPCLWSLRLTGNRDDAQDLVHLTGQWLAPILEAEGAAV